MSAYRKTILPGFGLSLGFTLFYLGVIVLIPLGLLILKSLTLTWDEFYAIVTAPRVVASYKLSFGASFVAAMINGFFGLILAWVLVRYRFPGKRILDALVDLPFALPTAVAGIALTSLYTSDGWLGQFLAPLGIKVAFTPLGVIIALAFIGLPFVVRTLQPVLMDLDAEVEEASLSLGANRWQTFYKVILPSIFPAFVTGISLAFAKALGEYGSVVFISGNLPNKTEIAPLIIMTELEQFNYEAATAIAVVILAASFVIMLFTNLLQHWSRVR